MTVIDRPVIWRDIEIDGRPTSFCDAGEARLYVCERHGAVEAWVDQVKIGNYADANAAKAATFRKVGLPHGGPEPVKLQASARAYTTNNPPPVADMSKPPVVNFVQPEPKVITTLPPVMEGSCKCGARLGRSGKCPALCEPVSGSPPAYSGPRFVGSTHIGRMAAPVRGNNA